MIDTNLETPLGIYAAVSVDGGDVLRVRNVRYATAGRFERPVAAEPDPAESADRQHARIACPQPPSASDELLGDPLRGATFDEDCLRLSITRPRDLGAARLPVMVWVHGGSYVSGAGDLGGYDPTVLVREQGVIVVNVTYRLGVLGFVGDGAGRPGNLGLLDLIEALKWVRAHIWAFGGDAANVTVFGQSAGADAVAHLMIANGAEALVRRAIVQSAPFGIRTKRDSMYQRMLTAMGSPDPDATIDELTAAQTRAADAAAGDGLRSGMPFGPQYGVAPLPAEADAEATWRQRAPGTEVLITWNREESSFFVELSPRLQAVGRVPFIGRMLRRALIAFTTTAIYSRDARRFAKLLAHAGATVHTAAFDGVPDGSRIGAAHAIELPLLFPNRDAWGPARLVAPHGALTAPGAGAALRAVWGEFARTGRVRPGRVPNGPGWSGGLTVTDALMR